MREDARVSRIKGAAAPPVTRRRKEGKKIHAQNGTELLLLFGGLSKKGREKCKKMDYLCCCGNIATVEIAPTTNHSTRDCRAI